MKLKLSLKFAAILLIAAVCARADDGPPVTSDPGHPDGTTLPGGSVTADPGGAGNDYSADPLDIFGPTGDASIYAYDGTDYYLGYDWYEYDYYFGVYGDQLFNN